LKRFVLVPLVLALLAACANDAALKEGQTLIAQGDADAGLAKLETAMREHPGDAEYRAVYLREKEREVVRRIAAADAERAAGRYESARVAYQRVLALHPENPRARAALADLDALARHAALVKEAEAAFAKDDADSAGALLRRVLAQDARNPAALALQRRINEADLKKTLEPPKLGAAARKPVSLEFKDAPLRSVFDMISRQSGVNFVLDKDVRPDLKATIFARNTTVSDAIDLVLLTSQLEKKVLNENTVLVFPALPAKLKDYQDLVVKSFYLANADVKQTVNMIKTVLKTRDVFIDEKIGLLVMRDTPAAIRIAEKLIAAQDLPEAEVMLEVEVMEVKRSKLIELGINYPTTLSVITPDEVVNSVADASGVITTTTTPATNLTIQSLKNLTDADFGVSPNPSAVARQEDSDVNILATPRIRVKNKEKAKIHVGDKVPVITSNVTSTGVVSETVSFLDVGLKLDVEPTVHGSEDVAIKIALEVSNIVREVTSATGTLTYQLGTRNASTVLRLKDGETQILAGLISSAERETAGGLPYLSDLPLLGRLFKNQKNEQDKTEIVLLITPRIVRALSAPQPALLEFPAGTESRASSAPLSLRPASQIKASSPAAGAAPGIPPRPTPATRATPSPAPTPEDLEDELDPTTPVQPEAPPTAQGNDDAAAPPRAPTAPAGPTYLPSGLVQPK
jgi:general secretion pathway protein D